MAQGCNMRGSVLDAAHASTRARELASMAGTQERIPAQHSCASVLQAHKSHHFIVPRSQQQGNAAPPYRGQVCDSRPLNFELLFITICT